MINIKIGELHSDMPRMVREPHLGADSAKTAHHQTVIQVMQSVEFCSLQKM